MNYIYVGEIVNTHGIKGEVRLLSDFKYKLDIFKKGFTVYLGKEKIKLTINTYRHHKIFDMVTFQGIDDINDVLDYKGMKVYINKSDLKIDGILDEYVIGLKAYNDDKLIGEVTEILKNKAHDILVIEHDDKRYLVPYIDEFVTKIDLKNKRIYLKLIEGMLNEN